MNMITLAAQIILGIYVLGALLCLFITLPVLIKAPAVENVSKGVDIAGRVIAAIRLTVFWPVTLFVEKN